LTDTPEHTKHRPGRRPSARAFTFGVQHPPFWMRIAIAIVAVAFSTGLIYPLKTLAPVISLGVVYLPGVLLVSAYWGLWLGLMTALLSLAAFNYFQIPPVFSFTASSSDWVAFAVFGVAATAMSGLSGLARRRALEAEEGEHQARLSRARVVAAADEERRRVVTGLHDGAQQRLVAGIILLKEALRAVEAGDPDARALLEKGMQHAEHANGDLRDLALDVLPQSLSRTGLCSLSARSSPTSICR